MAPQGVPRTFVDTVSGYMALYCIFSQVAMPLMKQLPEGSTMIATQVASPFLTPFKTTIFAALFLAMPVVLFQMWSFTAPGLYENEKRFETFFG